MNITQNVSFNDWDEEEYISTFEYQEKQKVYMMGEIKQLLYLPMV